MSIPTHTASNNTSTQPSGQLVRWTALVARHPWRVLAAALVAFVVFAGVATSLSGDFSDSFNIPGAESQTAYDLLEERFPQQSGSTATLVFQTEADEGITDPAMQSRIQAVLDEVAGLPHVGSILSPYDDRLRDRDLRRHGG